MNRKALDTKKYLAVLLITLTIFATGLLVGHTLSSQKASIVSVLQSDLRTEAFDLEVAYSLLEQDPCSFVDTTPVTRQLYDLGNRLDHMESVLGENNSEVLRLKQYYSILQIRQWLFEEKIVDECSANRTLILYFYDNTAGVCDGCDEQGFVLTYLRKKYDFVSVYSFDLNARSDSLQALQLLFGVTKAPTIIVGDVVLEEFTSLEELEALIIFSS